MFGGGTGPTHSSDRFNKYFTFKNSYRYIDVLHKFVRAYNGTVHTTTGIAPSKVTDSEIYTYGSE